ncbi:MAG: hypothetical protein J07HQW1_01718 [Haloquadratum walsbyi J07HQW1]|uniref:Uncharacterized protein n=1 Tax=Haloquadratum walsbyi J07HQW1 TaxID=1238424 RepID=U1MP47_9EURY|nr:MAG: hypothetical protein J07HQW1_01718 [Haloquadratum walsbyi J07HQW1]
MNSGAGDSPIDKAPANDAVTIRRSHGFVDARLTISVLLCSSQEYHERPTRHISRHTITFVT